MQTSVGRLYTSLAGMQAAKPVAALTRGSKNASNLALSLTNDPVLRPFFAVYPTRASCLRSRSRPFTRPGSRSSILSSELPSRDAPNSINSIRLRLTHALCAFTARRPPSTARHQVCVGAKSIKVQGSDCPGSTPRQLLGHNLHHGRASSRDESCDVWPLRGNLSLPVRGARASGTVLP